MESSKKGDYSINGRSLGILEWKWANEINLAKIPLVRTIPWDHNRTQ
jgi:hypothetical protein